MFTLWNWRTFWKMEILSWRFQIHLIASANVLKQSDGHGVHHSSWGVSFYCSLSFLCSHTLAWIFKLYTISCPFPPHFLPTLFFSPFNFLLTLTNVPAGLSRHIPSIPVITGLMLGELVRLLHHSGRKMQDTRKRQKKGNSILKIETG